eukprot:TRINITY_DN5851_c1_g1_i2.p1 TRINITY_DN5851_c1_g1~~TRINITY_DN5851_c1_g1_i2.p1  ORF type:complete len:123 (-),score=10.85 TRINITY_DN5851_c1_g1_i2:910-1278(-)
MGLLDLVIEIELLLSVISTRGLFGCRLNCRQFNSFQGESVLNCGRFSPLFLCLLLLFIYLFNSLSPFKQGLRRNFPSGVFLRIQLFRDLDYTCLLFSIIVLHDRCFVPIKFHDKIIVLKIGI